MKKNTGNMLQIKGTTQKSKARTSPSKKLDVLLVSTSFEEIPASRTEKEVERETDFASYPLGLPYLHGYLESKGHKTETLFFNNHPYWLCKKLFIRKVKEFKPAVIGFQMISQNRTSTFRIIEYMMKNFPDVKLVIGGIHATLMYEQIIKRYPSVYAVLGEGEITLGELVKEFGRKNPQPEFVQGIAFKKGRKVLTTEKRPLLQNIDELPFPKHEIFFDRDRDCASLLTTRGCPFRCSFCALDSISHQVHRKRSVQNVLDEIDYLVKKFPKMSKIWIHDDTFFLDNQRVMDLCDEIAKRKYTVQFIASARVKPICKKMVKKLERANFRSVFFGLESGSAKVLHKTHKNITREDVVRAFKLFKDSKIEISTFLIVGLPGETKETIIESAKFVKELQKIKYAYFIDISVLLVYPGTEINTLAEKAGIISPDLWLTTKDVPYYTVEHDVETLFEYKKLLLDHISFLRVLTPRGFIKQYDMIPHMVKYFWRNREKIYDMFAKEINQRIKA